MALSYFPFHRRPRFIRIFAATGGLIFISTGGSRAAELRASDGRPDDYFGWSVSLSGSMGLVSAYWDDDKGTDSGSAYVFRDLGATGATVNHNVHLIASDGAADDRFGSSVSLFGNIGLIGAHYDDKNASNHDAGSAYVFRGLNTATGTLHQVLKLTASDAATNDHFGDSVSLYGSTGLVGARFDDDRGSNSGSAYVFRNLDTATGSLTQGTKLTALDGAEADYFGSSVSLFGTIGLVGAWGDNAGAGSAYVFRGLDALVTTKTQELKLTASDAEADDRFGAAVSLHGSLGLVGAYQSDDTGYGSGSAYVFRGLDTKEGVVTEDAKLLASDADWQDWFGHAVGLSGATALVGAHLDDDHGSNSGSVYLFRHLDTAAGTIFENVKLTASSGQVNDFFGYSVAMDGDRFIIGAKGRAGVAGGSGSAFTGSVGSMTTLNSGGTARIISGISFTSKDDWIVGETTDGNSVTLSAGDTANITASGRAVYVGKNSSSDHNVLAVQGSVLANSLHIGATGNTGNRVDLGSGGAIHTSGGVHVAAGSSLAGNGTITGPLNVSGGLSPGGTGVLRVGDGNVSLASGSIFNWQLTSNTTSGAGVNYGGLQITDGNLTIASNAVFRVVLAGSADLANAFWEVDRTWSGIFGVTGGTTTSGWLDQSVSAYSESGSPIQTAPRGTFQITGTTLTWTPVPEPSTLLVGFLMATGLLRRSRSPGREH